MSVAVGRTPELVTFVALPFTWRWSRDSRSVRSVQSAISTAPPRLRTSWRSVEISRDGSTIISMSFPT